VTLAAALCTALVAAVPASAKLADYTADLLPAPPGGNQWVDFRVKLKKNKQTKKFRPVAIKKSSVSGLELHCSDNETSRLSFTWGELKTNPGVPEEIPVSNRRFDFSFSGGYAAQGGPFNFTFVFSGRVPRNGPPTGTLRYTSTEPKLVPNPADPEGPYITAQVSCDSGPLHWTGKRLPDGSLEGTS
jgi:hypothetical protein